VDQEDGLVIPHHICPNCQIRSQVAGFGNPAGAR